MDNDFQREYELTVDITYRTRERRKALSREGAWSALESDIKSNAEGEVVVVDARCIEIYEVS